MPGTPGVPLTVINGGINRLRLKGGADPASLFDLLNGYVTQSGTVKVRPGTLRNANIGQYSGAGMTKGLVAYQDQFHVFSSAVCSVPPGYALHVLGYPPNSQLTQTVTVTPPSPSADPYWADVTLMLPGPYSLGGSTTPGTFLEFPWATYGFLSGTADFTLEAWATMPSPANVGSSIFGIDTDATAFGTCNMNVAIHSSAVVTPGGGQMVPGFGGQSGLSGNHAISPGQRVQVAFVRHSNFFQLYIDGTAVSGAVASNLGSYVSGSGGLLTFGYANGSGSTEPLTMDNIRLTNGVARYTANFTPPSTPLPNATTTVTNPTIKEIHFAAPYLGGLYVVAEFNVTQQIADTLGSVFHFWIQSSTEGDNTNFWTANTDHIVGDVVIPTTPNGLIYVASRLSAANPVWTPNTTEALANVVEPTVANGFKYTVTVVEGALPTTGTSEPVWPAADGATVSENSALQSDQTFSAATAATAPAPSVPIRYGNNGPVFGS